MLKRLVIIVAILVLLAIILDPYQQAIKNTVTHISNSALGIDEPDTTDDMDDSLDLSEPDRSGFDSTKILQGIDSIELAPKQQEIITK